MRSDRTAMEERRRSCPLCGAKMTPPAICCTAGNTEDNAKKHPFWGAFLRFTVRYDSACAGWNTSAAMWDSASSDAPLSVVRL